MNSIFATSQIGFRTATFMLGGAGLEPADGCIIVVRSGIDDLARGAMRQIHVRTLVAEAELQHRHTRNLQPFPQSVHFGIDVAEIFGEKWQSAESFAQLVK